LPITKNFCAEAAFTNAGEAIQVLGGAGYTTEWAAEQYLRDARVLSIYEGTSGMQALDLVGRRVLGDEGRAMQAFLSAAEADLAAAGDGWAAQRFGALLALLRDAAAGLAKPHAQSVAYPFLQLASLATTGWVGLRLAGLSGDPVRAHLATLGRHWLRLALPWAQAEAAQVAMGPHLTEAYGAIDPALAG
jgi:hypothetical protein